MNADTTAAGSSPVERGVRPHAHRLASQLQNAAYNSGYEDAHPANATTRQAKADARTRETLAALYAEIDRMHELADSEGTRAVENLRRARKAEAILRELADTGAEVCDLTPQAFRNKMLTLSARARVALEAPTPPGAQRARTADALGPNVEAKPPRSGRP